MNVVQKFFDDYVRQRRLGPYVGSGQWVNRVLYERVLHVVDEGCAFELAVTALDKIPEGSPLFGAVLSYLSVDEFGDLIAVAMQRRRHGQHNAADKVISYASLQVVEQLHTYLPELWESPYTSEYYGLWPWRFAPLAECERLATLHDAGSSTQPDWQAPVAWQALVTTRTEPGLRMAIERNPESPDLRYWFWTDAARDLRDGELVPLCSNTVAHLVFAPGYLWDSDPAFHPTWHNASSGPALTAAFGGVSAAECGFCGGPLHHLLTLDPVPTGLGVTSCNRVEFATCLSCLGVQRECLAITHDERGTPSTMINPDPHAPLLPPFYPHFAPEAFPRTQVQLMTTEPRWRFQDCSLSNGRENLNRVGGEPTWVQSADYPDCPNCKTPMRFIFQLDAESGLPDKECNAGLWGGGIAYFFWCDTCSVSSGHWQCS